MSIQRRIGEFMVAIDEMSAEQVLDVLQVQRGGDSRLFGEIAVEKGYIEDESVKRYLVFLETEIEITDEGWLEQKSETGGG